MQVVNGFFGEEDEVQIPQRSLRMITDIVWDLEGTSEAFDRSVSFRAIRDNKDVNHSEVVVNTVSVDGRQVDAEVRIIYRNGSFHRASAEQHGTKLNFIRLVDALKFIENPAVKA